MARMGFQEALRLHHAVTAKAEKKLLIAMAQQLPRCINSDHLTALGLLSLVGAGASYWYASVSDVGLWLVIACLAINWFGDSLDGTVARVRDQQRPRYGFYVDHICDALGTIVLVAGMAASGYLSWAVAALLLVAYLTLCIEVYLATYAVREFRISFAGFGPTELRIVIAIGNLALLTGFRTGWTPFGRFAIFDIGGVIATIAISAILFATIAKHTAQLYREETIR
jgi:archaetidylinositol phosphate synthase